MSELLLTIIERRKRKDAKTGEVSFDSSDGMVGDALAVLESSVKFDETIPESKYRGLTFRSLVTVAESKALTVKAFDDELCRLERAYKKQPPKRCVLTTSLSAMNFSDSLSHTGISDTRINFGERMPKLFQVEHERMRQYGHNALFGDLPKTWSMIRRYTFVRVSVCAKSEIEAVDSALDDLNLLRAIWKFYLNYPQAWRSSEVKRNSVNKIVLGPVHSLHEPNGKSAVDYNWYEPHYYGPLKPVRLDRYLDAMRIFERTHNFREIELT